MKIKRGRRCGRRPRVALAPEVARGLGIGRVAHDIIMDWLVFRTRIVLSLEDIIKPRQGIAGTGKLAGIGRVFQFSEGAVRVRPEDEPAAATRVRSAVLLDGHKGVDRSLEEDVIPAAEKDAGGTDMLSLRFGIQF